MKRAAIVVGLAAVLLGGCAEVPQNPIPAAVQAADSMSVEAAASTAMTQVTAYLASNATLPATLADAGYVLQDGIAMTYTPGSGSDFTVCAAAGDYAFQGHAGSVTAVASC